LVFGLFCFWVLCCGWSVVVIGVVVGVVVVDHDDVAGIVVK